MLMFRLCLVIGVPHPDYLIDMLTSRQLGDWLAFMSIETIGDERADLRTAIMAMSLNNRWRGKNEPPTKPTDYMPHYRAQEQTPEQMHAMMAGIPGVK